MNVGTNLLHYILKIIDPFNKNSLFEEREYLHDIFCMWFLGFKTVNYFCSSNSWFRNIYIFKRSSTNSSNIGALAKKKLYKINLNYTNKNVLSSAELDKANDINVEQCSSISKMNSNGGSDQESNSAKKLKKRPNYFIAIQITDHKVHSSIKTIQDHILLQDEDFKNYLISRSTLHITLEVMHLKGLEDHSRALKALNAVHKKYNCIMCKEPLQLEFTGVGHFGNRVLFAKIKENSSYNRLCDLAENVGQQLESAGINVSDYQKKFNPHLTIAKLSYVKKKSKVLKKIPPSFYEEFRDFHFGYDVVKSIQLLKMAGPKTSSGYYMGDELFFSLKEPIFWKNLSSLLAIAEKKRDIRKKISKLAENLLK